MKICILDTETTGLDSATVIEVAVILYSVEHATPLESYASLIRHHENPAEAINRIPPSALAGVRDAAEAWHRVEELADDADVMVAHRADFDRPFCSPPLQAKPWVCSKFDITWPRQQKPGESLVQLALAHDLGVAYAHRAMADCDLLARLFTRAHELGADLEAMLERGMRPKAQFVALVSYEDRDKAKQAGFAWDPDRKRWWRRMAIEDAAALPFPTRRLA